jgi:hypothetical protein
MDTATRLVVLTLATALWTLNVSAREKSTPGRSERDCTIEGKVNVYGGESAANIWVQLLAMPPQYQGPPAGPSPGPGEPSQPGKPVARKRLPADGTFRFDNLPAGDYKVLAHRSDARKRDRIIGVAGALVGFPPDKRTVSVEMRVPSSKQGPQAPAAADDATDADSENGGASNGRGGRGGPGGAPGGGVRGGRPVPRNDRPMPPRRMPPRVPRGR